MTEYVLNGTSAQLGNPVPFTLVHTGKYRKIRKLKTHKLSEKANNLNCCLFWTTCVISTKFAGYVDWILICKLCKFGKYICYNCRDIEFFL